MREEIRVPLIPAVIVISVFFLLCIILYGMKEAESRMKANLQKRLDEAVVIEHDLEAKLRDFEVANAEMKTKMISQEEKIGILNKMLEDEKSAAVKSFASLQANEAEIANLKSELEQANMERDRLIKDMQSLNESYLNLKFQLQVMVETKEEMEARVKELVDKQGVSLGTIVINQKTK